MMHCNLWVLCLGLQGDWVIQFIICFIAHTLSRSQKERVFQYYVLLATLSHPSALDMRLSDIPAAFMS